MERIGAYLRGLKASQNLSWAEIAERSNLPESTVRKIISGQTDDPRYSTLQRIISAMGGDMRAINIDDILRLEDDDSPEVQDYIPAARANTTLSEDSMELIEHIKTVYEAYIADMKSQHRDHVVDLEKANHEQYDRLSRAAGRHIMSLRVACIALAAVVLLYFIIDLCISGRGWILY